MKIIIFKIADKSYAVDISKIQEVIRMRQVISVPEAAAFVEGVTSLDGKVVPVINLRVKLGFERIKQKKGRIIIIEMHNRAIGLIVDEVTEVLNIDEGNISPPDEVLKNADYLIGVAKIRNNLTLFMDMDKFLGKEEADIENVHSRIEIRKKVKG